MPTPFMHLALAARLNADPALPGDVRGALTSDGASGAFLLGSIAPDARLSSGTARDNTHFYRYGPTIDPRPVTAMLTQYANLNRARLRDAQQIAFMTGYAAHLTMDEIWCVEMLFPHFVLTAQAPQDQKQLMVYFHLLVATLDQRDRALLPDVYFGALSGAHPQNWVPFIADGDLAAWRDVVAAQLAPRAASKTNEILGKVIGLGAHDLQAAINDAEHMRRVWEQVAPDRVRDIEERMYQAVRQTVIDYLRA